MNEDNWYQDYDDPNRPSDPEASASKPGMSTAMKVLIGFLIAGGVMGVLCCGVAVYFTSRIMSMATEDPAKIQEIQEKIGEIDLPDGWEPAGGVDGGMFGFNIETVVYENGDAALMVMQFDVPGQISEEEMREQFEQSMQRQGRNTDIDVEAQEERTLTVAGEETTFQFVKGTTNNGQDIRQVTGAFSGRGGPAFLVFHTPEEDWDEERVTQMIESIQK